MPLDRSQSGSKEGLEGVWDEVCFVQGGRPGPSKEMALLSEAPRSASIRPFRREFILAGLLTRLRFCCAAWGFEVSRMVS